jgi:hypothetical protein
MTDTPYDAAMTRSKQELARQVVDANVRIDQLEAALQMIVLSSKDGASIEVARAALANTPGRSPA